MSGPEGRPDRVHWLEVGTTLESLDLGPFTFGLREPFTAAVAGWYLLRAHSPGPGLPVEAEIVRMVTACWARCQCCGDYWCTRHGVHTHECPCPPIEEWGDVDPYLRGGGPGAPDTRRFGD